MKIQGIIVFRILFNRHWITTNWNNKKIQNSISKIKTKSYRQVKTKSVYKVFTAQIFCRSIDRWFRSGSKDQIVYSKMGK